jgi:uncharacterized protein DUF397
MRVNEQVNHWRKSRLSSMNGNCVEVRQLGERRVGVRDSKDAQGPVLSFSPVQWRAFMASAKDGVFDL